MNRLYFFWTIVLALVFIGCSSNPEKPAPSASTTTSNSPAWIDNPELPDAITGVGIAQSNPLGDKAMQRTTAVANARVDLAQKVRTRVQNMFAQLNQQATSAGGTGAKSDVASRMIENTSRVLTDQSISGSIVRQTWTDPADGNLYAFVVLNKTSVDQAMTEIAKAQIQKEISQGGKNLDTALQKLDAAVDSLK